MISLSDTILAVATPPGRGARAVLRLSGPAALEAVERLCGDRGEVLGAAGFSGLGVALQVEEGQIPAWVGVFRAPRSYTREDVVEIHLPSSPPLLGSVTRALALVEGVRWAGPGEFTLRAFLNGRIDLSQAEAVAQVVSAIDEHDARAARRGLAGDLRSAVDVITRELTEAIALLEAALDFAEEELPEIEPAVILERITALQARVDGLRRSTLLRLSAAGVHQVVLAGFPNAGKSSLLNAILRQHAALVSGLAGTTRDPVRGQTAHGGTQVDWVDLAGTLSVDDLYAEGEGSRAGGPAAGLKVELADQIGSAVRRLSRVELEHADSVLWVLDPTDRADAALAEFSRLGERASFLVVNKIDLLDSRTRERWRACGRAQQVHLVSARHGSGVEELVQGVLRQARGSPGRHRVIGSSPRFLVSAHQESALLRSAEAIQRARAAVECDLGYECVAADLRDALEALEELAGKVTSDEILGHIFSRFCVGK